MLRGRAGAEVIRRVQLAGCWVPQLGMLGFRVRSRVWTGCGLPVRGCGYMVSRQTAQLSTEDQGVGDSTFVLEVEFSFSYVLVCAM